MPIMMATQSSAAEPFRVQVGDGLLRDLRTRIRRTRWPDEAEAAGWDLGASLVYVKELADYWLEKFDWKAQERRLNSFHQYRARVDGWNVHFVHEKGRGPDPLPIMISHGWPESFAGMLKLVPLLSDPEAHGGNKGDSFDVVVPSLPGYGFSDRRLGRGPVKFYEILLHLMTDVLGYQRFGAQGGDVGAGITSDLGRAAGDNVIGIHLHSNLALPSPKPSEETLSPAEKEYYGWLAKWEEDEGAYSHIQSTKPQTIAYGLNDSPVALAAYIVEKFRDWGDTSGNVESRFTKDELLTNVMIYWVTQTMNSAMRGYYESRRNPRPPWKVGRVQVPTGVALFPHDFDFPHSMPRELAERSYNIRRWVEMARGGHFAASEEPEALARDIREFFRPLRSST